MIPKTYTQFLFFSAALVNWGVGFGLLFWHRQFLGLLAPENIPTQPMFAHLFAVVVIVFGFGYYKAISDLKRYREVIWLGALAKIPVFLVPVIYWITGTVSGNLALLATVDLIYALLFVGALKRLPSQTAIESDNYDYQ